MVRFISLLVVLISFTGSRPISSPVEVINLEQLQTKTRAKNDVLYVVNFWATWCRPCVQEIPYFEEAAKKYSDQHVNVLLVSLDFLSEKERVNTFVANKNIQSPVYLLNAGNPNTWIDSIDSTWGGAIPATVFYKNGQKTFFYEGELTKSELDSLIQQKR